MSLLRRAGAESRDAAPTTDTRQDDRGVARYRLRTRLAASFCHERLIYVSIPETDICEFLDAWTELSVSLVRQGRSLRPLRRDAATSVITSIRLFLIW